MKQLESNLKKMIYNGACIWSRLRIDKGDVIPSLMTDTLSGKNKLYVPINGNINKESLKVIYISEPNRRALMDSYAVLDGSKLFTEREENTLFFDVFKITLSKKDKKTKDLYAQLEPYTGKTKVQNNVIRNKIAYTLGLDNSTKINSLNIKGSNIIIDLIKEVGDRTNEDSWDNVRNDSPCLSKYKDDPMGERLSIVRIDLTEKNQK